MFGPVNRKNTMEKKIRFPKIKIYFLNFRFILSPHQTLPLFHANGPMAMAMRFDRVNIERDLHFSPFPLSLLCFSSSHLRFSMFVKKRAVRFWAVSWKKGNILSFGNDVGVTHCFYLLVIIR